VAGRRDHAAERRSGSPSGRGRGFAHRRRSRSSACAASSTRAPGPDDARVRPASAPTSSPPPSSPRSASRSRAPPGACSAIPASGSDAAPGRRPPRAPARHRHARQACPPSAPPPPLGDRRSPTPTWSCAASCWRNPAPPRPRSSRSAARHLPPSPSAAQVAGGTIDEIAADHVVIAVGAERRLLAFPDRSGTRPRQTGATPAATAPPRTIAAPPPPPVTGPAPTSPIRRRCSPASVRDRRRRRLPRQRPQPADEAGRPPARRPRPARQRHRGGRSDRPTRRRCRSAFTNGTARMDLVRAGQPLTFVRAPSLRPSILTFPHPPSPDRRSRRARRRADRPRATRRERPHLAGRAGGRRRQHARCRYRGGRRSDLTHHRPHADPRSAGARAGDVTSAEPLSSADGVWDLFQSVLRVHGFAAIRSGRVWRIVPQAERGARCRRRVCRRAGDDSPDPPAQRRARNGRAHLPAARRAVRQRRAADQARTRSSSPIMPTISADRGLARSLDGSGGTSFERSASSRASAKDVGQAIQGLFGTAEGAPRVAVDERSNVILVRGDPRGRRSAPHGRADGPPRRRHPHDARLRLKNADSESVTSMCCAACSAGSRASRPIRSRALAGRARADDRRGHISGCRPTATPRTTTVRITRVAPIRDGSSGRRIAAALGSSQPQSHRLLHARSRRPVGARTQRDRRARHARRHRPDRAADRATRCPSPAGDDRSGDRRGTADKAEALGVQFGLGKGMPGINGATSLHQYRRRRHRDVLARRSTPVGRSPRVGLLRRHRHRR
jgi:hypothetical protein